jgi:replicative DNA helicase
MSEYDDPEQEDDPGIEGIPEEQGLVLAAEAEPAGEAPGGELIPIGQVLGELERQSKDAASETAAQLLPVGRTPPNAMDAERALLGGLLLDPAALEKVIEVGLSPDDFYRAQHGIVFKAILDLHNQAEPIDALTVTEELLRRGELEKVGGPVAISQLEALIPTAAHVGSYSRMVHEKSTLRFLIHTATTIVESAYEQNKRVGDIVDEAERAILQISEKTTRRGIMGMKELVQRATEQLEKAYNEKRAVTGVPTGFTDIDQMTSGWQGGDLVIIAARPSMGKTAFTLNVAAHAAVRAQSPVAFFSLEMGADQLVQRLLGAEADIDISALRRGFIQSGDWVRLAQAASELGDAPLFIDETPALSVAEMRTKCRRLKHEHDISIAIIDYLQLMTGPPGIENKAQEVGEISKGLKSLARELSIPVIALSQLNRGVESRTDKRPMMSDLRESGAIEQDADLIGFLYREEYYLKDKTPEDKLGVAEFIIGKHRNGPTGAVELQFKASTTRFRNLERTHDYV